MTINALELRKFAEIAEAAARAGGGELRRMFGSKLTIEHKGIVDLVTDADRCAEAAIVAVLRNACPDHDILAEEGDYGMTSALWRWVVDPLDGTTNYAHGFPWFAVSIGLEHCGSLVVGVVYQPMLEELYLAVRGQGASLNKHPIRVSRIAHLGHSLLATGFPYDRKDSQYNNYDHFTNFQQAAQACRRPGVASLDLACVAAGRFDGYWEMKLKPWDMAAGVLLVREAGGEVSDFSGGGFNLYGTQCLVSNGLIHDAMIDVLRRGRCSP